MLYLKNCRWECLELNKGVIRVTTFLLACGVITGCSPKYAPVKSINQVEAKQPKKEDNLNKQLITVPASKKVENPFIYKNLTVIGYERNDDSTLTLEKDKVYSGYTHDTGGNPIEAFAYKGNITSLQNLGSISETELVSFEFKEGNIIEGKNMAGETIRAILPENLAEKIRNTKIKGSLDLSLFTLSDFKEKVAYVFE